MMMFMSSLAFSLLVYRSKMAFCFSLMLSFMISILMYKHNMDFYVVNSKMLLDSLSLPLVSLTIWITLLMVLASNKILSSNKFNNLFTFIIAILMIILVSAFMMTNWLYFYILFEVSLIPTFILILGWGYQPERIQAGVYMMMYTLFASLPLLMGLFMLNEQMYTLSMILPVGMSSSSMSMFFMLIMISAFLVKLPMYLLHLWLPKAHVEAPVAGSMILAGVLLKLGGYGLIRILPKMNEIVYSWSWLLMVWSLMGGVYTAMFCIRQKDIKMLIALSSVAHMSFVIASSLTFTVWGLNSALFIMLGHGFCSAGLFCIANMSYERLKTRSLYLIKGIMNIAPTMTIWWFLLSISNMAAPPSLNLLGEMTAIIAIYNWSYLLFIPLVWLTFLSGAYSLYLYSKTQHGDTSEMLYNYHPPTIREHFIMSLHWLPLNLIFMKSSICTYLF